MPTEKFVSDENYLNHAFEDMYRFAKESEDQILIDYVEAVKDSIIISNEKQYADIPMEASLKISSIFHKIPKDNPSLQYFLYWKEELVLFLERLRAANKSAIKFMIWQCRMNVMKTIEQMVLAHDKTSQSYNKNHHESQ